MTILIYGSSKTEDYEAPLRAILPEVPMVFCSTPEEAAAHVAEAEIIFSWRFPTELFRRAERLRWVQAMGAGVEDLIAAPLPPGCLVTRVEGLFGTFMSEYALAHMLAHTQQLHRLYANQAAQRWESFYIGRLAGKRLGLAGVGSIGAELARRARAMGMEVWGLARSARSADDVDRLFAPEQAADFAAGVDYLVSTLPLTPETRGLIDPRRMREGALLINMGRGATIDEAALLEAVQSGRIQAVLDVFAVEPLPVGHPFWSTPGITVTPHLSGPSVPAEVAEYFAANYRRYQAGQPLVGLVDRQRGY